MQLQIKRIYDSHEASDGKCILVDRLWLRGIKKEAAELFEWNRKVSPSTELRKWFNHEAEKFPEFSQKYIDELNNSEAAATFKAEIQELLKTSDVTLLYAAKDAEHNNALVLKNWLEKI